MDSVKHLNYLRHDYRLNYGFLQYKQITAAQAENLTPVTLFENKQYLTGFGGITGRVCDWAFLPWQIERQGLLPSTHLASHCGQRSYKSAKSLLLSSHFHPCGIQQLSSSWCFQFAHVLNMLMTASIAAACVDVFFFLCPQLIMSTHCCRKWGFFSTLT